MLSSGLAAGLLKLSSVNSAALGISALADPSVHSTSFLDAQHGDVSLHAVPSDGMHGPGHGANHLKDVAGRVDEAFDINTPQREALFNEAKDTIIKVRSGLLGSADAPAVASQVPASSSTPASFLTPVLDDPQVHSSSASPHSHGDAAGRVGHYLQDMEARVDEAFNINAQQREALFNEAKDTIIKARSAILGGSGTPADVSRASVGLLSAAAFMTPVADGASMMSPVDKDAKVHEGNSQAGMVALLFDALGLMEAAQAASKFAAKHLVCSFGKDRGFRSCDPRSA
eukprot:TRINITY_DN23028_c0_g1_i1.p1 TRINITY_DN23028_c0_g1~~TRINITY_DN23028_c0_g1_i1.p1  ORF type:complete len:286 (-),score=59.61 TRINITY_DN23028_c0_g1_i1:258-1115(-)